MLENIGKSDKQPREKSFSQEIYYFSDVFDIYTEKKRFSGLRGKFLANCNWYNVTDECSRNIGS